MKSLVKINLRSILTGIVLVLFLAGAIFFMRRNKPAQVVTPPPQAAVGGMAVYRAALKVLGPVDASVKFVEYSDFECPSCRTAHEVFRSLFADYPGKIQLTFKHYPLTSHKWSIYAHQAAECMNAQGKFWSYHDKLYGSQAEWALSPVAPVEILARYAGELGADMKRFGQCMADAAVAHSLYVEKEEGNQRQVNATPTFFLGDERFVGPRELKERGENAIRKVLGLSANPVPEKKPEPLAPAPLKGAVR